MSQTILISRSELCKLFNCKPPTIQKWVVRKGFPSLYPVLPGSQSFDTKMSWIGLRVSPDRRLEMSKLSDTERFMTLFSGYTRASRHI